MALRYSRQRQVILDNLRSREDHPTADQIYTSIRQDNPSISLGTVYRNLAVLEKLGMIRTVSVGDGVVHYDHDTSPHSHFLCRSCGKIIDLPVPEPADVRRMIPVGFPGRIDGCSICYYGLCSDCAQQQDLTHSSKGE